MSGRHLGRPGLSHEDGEQAARAEKETKSTKAASRRQNSSMYHRAMQQRVEAGRDKERLPSIGELVSKICRATREDLLFKEEVSESNNDLLQNDLVTIMRKFAYQKKKKIEIVEGYSQSTLIGHHSIIHATKSCLILCPIYFDPVI